MGHPNFKILPTGLYSATILILLLQLLKPTVQLLKPGTGIHHAEVHGGPEQDVDAAEDDLVADDPGPGRPVLDGGRLDREEGGAGGDGVHADEEAEGGARHVVRVQLVHQLVRLVHLTQDTYHTTTRIG